MTTTCVKESTWHCTQNKNRLPESRLGGIPVTGQATRVAGVVSRSEYGSACQDIPAVCDCPECDLKLHGWWDGKLGVATRAIVVSVFRVAYPDNFSIRHRRRLSQKVIYWTKNPADNTTPEVEVYSIEKNPLAQSASPSKHTLARDSQHIT